MVFVQLFILRFAYAIATLLKVPKCCIVLAVLIYAVTV